MQRSLRHDLLNQLNIIQGNLELLAMDAESLTADQTEMVEEALHASRSMIELIEVEPTE